eukprot:TRINITY_DN24957_c0_g1_i1.p2 TRINITY_DN24957_c0_g1~~TRINITY_DN24957_c0_g1_i1.p2  ORF type:complete len:104 (+),score=22.77 TRINITY_DN24957_c0_g1_i1:84-395(+)
MSRRPLISRLSGSSAASDVYKRQVPGSCDPKSFEGTPSTTRPRSLYRSQSACRPSYCFVKPQKEAVLTTSTALPVYSCIDKGCLLYTSPSPRDRTRSRMPSSA